VNRPERTHSPFHWGASISYRTNLRSKELHDRIWWFLRMRWAAASCCLFIWGLLSLHSFGIQVNPKFFLWVGLALVFLNLIYTFFAKHFLAIEGELDTSWIRSFLRVQIAWDFVLVSYLSYHTGSIETPVLMLFMPHIILSGLFFSRIKSLIVVIFAWVFALVPLWLEAYGVLPYVSIFENSHKDCFRDSGMLLAYIFVIGVGLVFFTLWYVITEITSSLKHREHDLEKAYDLLQQLDTEKTQATLRATHELKAPFAAIKSYVYTLRDGYCGELPEKAKAVVNRIGERCDRLMNKITDIIHLSNIKTLVVSDLHFSPVDLIELLGKEVEELDLVGHERGISVQLLVESQSAVILGSKPQLKTLFSNLIRNAITYSFDDKTVLVRIQKGSRNQVCICVEDRGIGIPEELFERVFEEHFRSNEAVAHNPNGTGLGLPMVQELVKLHGGTIHLTSVVNEGTTFEITFNTIVPESKEGSQNDQDSNY